MESKDKEISFADLALEPLEGEQTAGKPTGKAKFQVDSRSYTERRRVEDRRNEIRFQADRRGGVDRRVGGDKWGVGV